MEYDDCLICKRYVAARERDVVIRQLVLRLVDSKFYPKIFRSIRALPLCASCLLEIPFIENDICEYCGKRMDNPIHREPIIKATIYKLLCSDCLDNKNKLLQCNRSVIRYNSWAKETMAIYKYRGEERLATIFAVLLLACYYRYVSSMSFQLVTYVPLHQNREEERGFNQVELIAKHFSQYTNIPVIPLLIRSKETEKQSHQSNKQARLRSMKNTFSAYRDPENRIQRTMKPILLIDDIYTTGSTMQSCAEAIQAIPTFAFSQIVGLTVCR
ncbi:ComF family protein [Brevibacillus sp. SYSU BS000544]|uniref:ComF family protein n=1 Tax=Brevibacillus sp. SYSU BS000544 TaxID=3416443 RepID=UPI003CE4B961